MDEYSHEAAHLVLDLLGGVGEVDGRVLAAGAHLGVEALERRDELAVQQSGLGVLETRRDIARHSEVGVL